MAMEAEQAIVSSQLMNSRNSSAKPLPKKNEKPNLQEYTEKVQKKREILTQLVKKMNEVTKEINECKNIQSTYIAKREELRGVLDSITSEITNLESKRSSILLATEQRKKEGREVKSTIQNLRRNLGFHSEEEVDKKIRDIEKYIISNKISVQQENQMIAKMQQLRQSKPLLMNYAIMEADASVQENSLIEEQRQQFTVIREEIKELQKKKRDVLDELHLLFKIHQQDILPLNDLWEKRRNIKKEIATHRQEEVALLQEFETRSKEYQLQTVLLQKESQQKKLEQMRRRNLEQAREALEKELKVIEADEGLSPQYILTQQMLSYVKTWVKKAEEIKLQQDKAANHSVTENDPATSPPFQEGGYILIKPKHQRDEEGFSCTSKKKTGKKLRKPASLKRALVHDISVLADFDRLSINPPLCLEDCHDCLKQLEEKLENLKEENARMEHCTSERKKELLHKLHELTMSA